MLATSKYQVLGEKILIALFLAGLSLPLLDRALSLDPAKELEENRVPAVMPAWPRTRVTLAQFPRAFEAYWNDAFGFRRTLIRAHARSMLALGVSPSTSVVVGRDSWLFYTGDDSVASFRGLRPLSPAELAQWRRDLEMRRDWLAARGIHYLFVVAPSKESVYPDEMPRRLNRVRSSRLDQLVGEMRAHSTVEVVDLRDALRAGKKAGTVYAFTDTHWNDRGALIAYEELMKRIVTWFPNLPVRDARSFRPGAPSPWSGDLALMLGMSHALEEERTELAPDPPYTSQLVASPLPTPDAFKWAVIETPNTTLPRALVFHDSFFMPPEDRGNPAKVAPGVKSSFRLSALMGESFSHSLFLWSATFDPVLIARERPDVVIEEIVERRLMRGAPNNAGRLMSHPPLR